MRVVSPTILPRKAELVGATILVFCVFEACEVDNVRVVSPTILNLIGRGQGCQGIILVFDEGVHGAAGL